MDGVKGCGIQIELELKKIFFTILSTISDMLIWSANQNLESGDNLKFVRFILSAF
jgi:hypothetical protein